MNAPGSVARRRWIAAAAAALLLPLASAAQRGKAPSPERQWIERSAALASAAKQHAGVARFRHDIEEHRERLRQIVRAGGANPPPPQLELQRTMILINALLHAAAECHAGGRLMCPADLLHQLDQQIVAGFAMLENVERAAS